MSEIDMKEEEVKTRLSLNKLNSDMFAQLEVSKNLTAVIEEMSKKIKSLKDAKKAVDRRVGDTQALILNEVRNGNTETVQYTLDCFENLQNVLEDVVYDEYKDNPKYNDIMAIITDLEMGYDPKTKASTVKGINK